MEEKQPPTTEEIEFYLSCASTGSLYRVREFLEKFGDEYVDVRSEEPANRSTALVKAICGGMARRGPNYRYQMEVVEFLVERGADIEAESTTGETPLVIAVIQDKTDAIRYLLSIGAKVDGDENEALRMAAWNNNAESVNILLDAGADVDKHKSKNAWTPLMTAVARGCPDAVEALLARGADIKISCSGKTVFDLEAADEIVQILQRHVDAKGIEEIQHGITKPIPVPKPVQARHRRPQP